MGREYDGMRDTVMTIRETNSETDIYSVTDVMKIVKKSRNYVKKNIMPDTNSIYIVELARRLCMISRGIAIK